MGLNNGKCDICGKKLSRYIQDESGNCYCSEECYESTLPKCAVCGKPMKQWTESEDGKKYCSQECYKQSWNKCELCDKPMDHWIESEYGKKYCSNECYKQSWNRCVVCNKPMDHWIESEDGEKYCSDECFLESCPTCIICGKHTDKWIQNDNGDIFCSKECRVETLPTCEICGSKMEEWLVSSDGKKFCSEECYADLLPKCMHCGRPMKEWIVTADGRTYCSEECCTDSDKLMSQVNTLCQMTGLSVKEIEVLLVEKSWSFKETANNIDTYMQSLNKKSTVSLSVIEALKNAKIYGKLSENLSTYNTMRGGTNGFKGFVFEELHAAESSLNGIATEVISNNGIADFQIFNPDGKITLGQAKAGYKTASVDWSKYEGLDIIIDKGNTKLIKSAKDAGMNVIESDIKNTDAITLSKKMQLESKILKNPKAPITSHLHSYHKAGAKAAKKGAAFGAGLSIGANLVNLATGDKDLGEVSADIIVDTTVATASSYVIGAGTTAIANTAIGSTVITGATAAGSAIAGTTAVTAVTGAASAAGAAIAGTTAATAITGAATAAATVIGSTAAGAAVVAAAPLVAAGAAVGAIFSIGKKIFS